LTEENLKRYWQFPTLFYHGHDNKVFDIESSRMSAYSLARFRKNQSLGNTGNEEDISTEEYTEFGVRLKTLKNYGHMDMIFGEDATKDIGPDIVAFLRAAEKQYKTNHGATNHGTTNESAMGVDYAQFYSTISSAKGISKSNKSSNNVTEAEALPVTSTEPERLPSAGPVLSHVTPNSVRL